MITTDLGAVPAARGYTPNCASSYNPCSEIQKAKAVGMAVPASLTAECAAFSSACKRGADMAAVKLSVTKFKASGMVTPLRPPTLAPGTSPASAGPTPEIGTGVPINADGTTTDPTTGQTIDPTTGLPVEPWYMNKTYWLIGGAVLVGGWLLFR